MSDVPPWSVNEPLQYAAALVDTHAWQHVAAKVNSGSRHRRSAGEAAMLEDR